MLGCQAETRAKMGVHCECRLERRRLESESLAEEGLKIAPDIP